MCVFMNALRILDMFCSSFITKIPPARRHAPHGVCCAPLELRMGRTDSALEVPTLARVTAATKPLKRKANAGGAFTHR